MTSTHHSSGHQLTSLERRDLSILIRFTSEYCAGHGHPDRTPFDSGVPGLKASSFGRPVRLCAACHELLAYAISRRLKCPLPDKPSCKHCQIHCYRPGHREKVREIMRYSGRRLIMRGRLDLLWHYLF